MFKLRLCMFGAAQVLLKRFGATPVHVWCSTGHQIMQKNVSNNVFFPRSHMRRNRVQNRRAAPNMHRRSSKLFKLGCHDWKSPFRLRYNDWNHGKRTFGTMMRSQLKSHSGTVQPCPNVISFDVSRILEPCNRVQICFRTALVDPNAT